MMLWMRNVKRGMLGVGWCVVGWAEWLFSPGGCGGDVNGYCRPWFGPTGLWSVVVKRGGTRIVMIG